MEASLRSYRNTLAIMWLLAIIGGTVYASSLSIPARVTVPALGAILVEIALYAAMGFESVRARLLRVPRARLAAGMVLSGLAPWLVLSAGLGAFGWGPFLGLAAAAGVASFWYVVLPRRAALDLAFVVLMAAPVLLKLFAFVYPTPFPKLRLDFLGMLMWIRLGAAAVLLIARIDVPGAFRFVPTRKEWAAGLRHFAYLLPIALAGATVLGVARFRMPRAEWYAVLGASAGTFLGMLWVVALGEELFFRGLLQEWLSRWTKREWAGLAIAAVLFGAVHLPFRGFPNWRFALLAAIAGVFYGRAYLQARSVCAAMVAHALLNTVWRIFFPFR